MSQFININSQLDALRIKEFEEKFYEKISDNVKIVPKVTPFKGINTDLLYIKDNKILFVKFMDTSEELFSILDEELIEVMNEEYNMLRLKMAQQHSNINYNFVYIMPYVEIYDEYESQEFVNNNIIDKNKLKQIIEKEKDLDIYLKEENNEIELNMYLLDICPEYYVLNNQKHINRDFKKITFVNDDYEYSATMLDKNELKYSLSINYGNNLFEGGSGTGKTTIMLSRAIKLARVYPQHRFIVFVSSKKLCNQLKEELEILKECLLGKKHILEISNMQKHVAWYNELKSHDFNENTVDQLLKEELTHKFVNVLEDAGVFKMNEEGKEAFIKFVEMVGEKE